MFLKKDNNAGSLVRQIAHSIAIDIEKGAYRKNERLPSINAYSQEHRVARDTIEKAYTVLKSQGLITSVAGKGYYVNSRPDSRVKVLLLFNKLSSYKREIYHEILNSVGTKVRVDLQVFHYDPVWLDELIDMHLDFYHYFVLMPHFKQESVAAIYSQTIKKIPTDRLIFLDKLLPGIPAHAAVYQDFENDIYEALTSVKELVKKYESLWVIFPPERNHPEEIKNGIQRFCKENDKEFRIESEIYTDCLKREVLYIVLTEADLGQLIKSMRTLNWIAGTDAGIISFNETVFKELLDITVITTDFQEMGRSVAQQILSNEQTILRNPFKIIIRNSL